MQMNIQAVPARSKPMIWIWHDVHSGGPSFLIPPSLFFTEEDFHQKSSLATAQASSNRGLNRKWWQETLIELTAMNPVTD